MGRRGPKPTPKALRVLRHPTATSRSPAPVAAADPPTLPPDLSVEEQASWVRIIGEMGSIPGLLARADRGVIELVARLEPAMRAAAVVVREQGSTVVCCDKDGAVKFIQQRAEAQFLLKASSLLKGLYAELGLTPSGRVRVSLTPAAPTSKLDTFLAGGTHGA